jgi:hypothetical protein
MPLELAVLEVLVPLAPLVLEFVDELVPELEPVLVPELPLPPPLLALDVVVELALLADVPVLLPVELPEDPDVLVYTPPMKTLGAPQNPPLYHPPPMMVSKWAVPPIATDCWAMAWAVTVKGGR